jgi:hypothetical protein
MHYFTIPEFVNAMEENRIFFNSRLHYVTTHCNMNLSIPHLAKKMLIVELCYVAASTGIL